LRNKKKILLKYLKNKKKVLKKLSHKRISEVIKKTRIREHNQMLINTLLYEFSDFRSHSDTFRIRESSNHLNQKKKDNDSRHIFSHDLRKHNENHFHNSRKMTQTD